MTPPHEPVEETARYGDGGEMHGAWSWHRTDGSLMRTGNFDRGRQVGTCRTFDRKGNVVKETSFDD